jgi:N-acetylglucosaminylphosphatidylinositol deacetylase
MILYVLVIAHPDDESMFFIPTLQNLKSSAASTSLSSSPPYILVWLVCLTNGNYNGLGLERQRELERVVTNHFHNQIDQLLWLFPNNMLEDDNNKDANVAVCEDHPSQPWNIPKTGHLLQTTLEQAMAKHIWKSTNNASGDTTCHSHGYEDVCHDLPVVVERISFITFDEYGVSGHVNHRDTHHTVRWLVYNWKPSPPPQQHQRLYQTPFADSVLHPQSAVIRGISSPDAPCSIIPLEAWQLQSEHNLLIKYLPILFWLRLLILWLSQLWNWLIRLLLGKQSSLNIPSHSDRIQQRRVSQHAAADINTTTKWILTSLQPQLNYAAMACHATQFVWYRRLFVVFSTYTYVNMLRPMDPEPTGIVATTILNNNAHEDKKIA